MLVCLCSETLICPCWIHPEPWCPLTPLCHTTQRVPQKIQNVQVLGKMMHDHKYHLTPNIYHVRNFEKCSVSQLAEALIKTHTGQ
ncbi:hypothetical protein FQN60_001658 [Etheostoma spectabile]|uniref:Uncharacterized protein n=1 Tax=Etheostoma spectabile TaxID=54343 RepID=A0A5J5D500_9PERO|nr:hypothetical protein FQN60_001658 [Etheostoma spectabile]